MNHQRPARDHHPPDTHPPRVSGTPTSPEPMVFRCPSKGRSGDTNQPSASEPPLTTPIARWAPKTTGVIVCNHNWRPPEPEPYEPIEDEFERGEVVLGVVLMAILGGLLGAAVYLAWVW